MARFRGLLVSTPPVRPIQHALRRHHCGEEQPGQQAANFRDRHRNQVLLFLGATACTRWRITASVACASIDNVMWRYQPGQDRTS